MKEGLKSETYHYRKDGTKFPVEVKAANMGNNILVSIISDITDRRSKEKEIKELAAIVESSKDAIIGRNLDGIVTSWNRGAEKIYGYTMQEASGRDVSLLIYPDSKNDMDAILEKVKNGEVIKDYEAQRRNKMSRYFMFL